jgi:PadR family transcriptional regulator PadR
MYNQLSDIDGQNSIMIGGGQSTTTKLDDVAQAYAENLTTQLRKGALSYLVLLAANGPVLATEVMMKLEEAGLQVSEGTIYPLLNRLARDQLLTVEWRPEEGGAPRKVYVATDLGNSVAEKLRQAVSEIVRTGDILSNLS